MKLGAIREDVGSDSTAFNQEVERRKLPWARKLLEVDTEIEQIRRANTNHSRSGISQAAAERISILKKTRKLYAGKLHSIEREYEGELNAEDQSRDSARKIAAMQNDPEIQSLRRKEAQSQGQAIGRQMRKYFGTSEKDWDGIANEIIEIIKQGQEVSFSNTNEIKITTEYIATNLRNHNSPRQCVNNRAIDAWIEYKSGSLWDQIRDLLDREFVPGKDADQVKDDGTTKDVEIPDEDAENI